METRGYDDWSLAVHTCFSNRRLPLNGTVEITRRCNNRCVHCYNNLPERNSQAQQKELSFKEHRRILDEITAAGCLWLLFTGGEIFVRPDFLDIYTYAKKKGLLITLFTNGTLITPEIADYLARWRPFSIEISLYGRSRQTYERITRVPGSFECCLEGIRLLRQRGLPLQLKTMVLTLNRHELADMQRFAEQQLGVEFKFDAMISPRLDCSQTPLQMRLLPEEIVALDLEDAARVAEWRRFAKTFNAGRYSPEHRRQLWQCGAGQTSFSIDPYGRMRMCELAPRAAYDLRVGSFQQGWEQVFGDLRAHQISRYTKCVDCGIKDMCGMCPVNAELEGADAESPVDFLCRVAHLRAYTFDIPIPRHGPCEYCPGGSRHDEIMRAVVGLRKARIV